MAGDGLKSKTETKQAYVKVFRCPSCGSNVTIRAIRLSVAAVCSSCTAVIDSTDENYKIIQKASNGDTRRMRIPLGQRGKFHGTEWEVIGYMERSPDGSQSYLWSEYLLYNPMKGYRWLTESNGHWNFVKTIKGEPEINGEYASYLGQGYSKFLEGSAQVVFVVGEFYWQVKRSEKVKVADYIAPPELLSWEGNEKERVWSLATYVYPEDIAQAFRIEKKLRVPVAVAPNQPTDVSDEAISASHWGWAFAGFVLIIQLVSLAIAKEKVVFSNTFTLGSGKAVAEFELDGGYKNLEISMTAPVKNTWIESEVELVNDSTGDTEEFEQGIEYYTGIDFDGRWHEGSQTASKLLSSIASGKYHLNMKFKGPRISKTEFPTGPIFTGSNPPEIRFTKWESGQILSEVPYVNGQMNGVAKYYFESGKLNMEVTFADGEKNGVYTVYDEDGKLVQIGSNLRNKLHGNVKWYDKNGKITRDVNYFEGNITPINEFGVDSNMLVKVVVRRDVTTWSNFFLASILLLILPLGTAWLKRRFEVMRWAESDFDPYADSRDVLSSLIEGDE